MKGTILALLILLATSALGQQTAYYSDSLTNLNTTNWTQNGSVTVASGLTATSTNGGSLISKVGVPDGTSGYEARTVLTLANSGGTYITYLRASTDAMSGPTPSGSYYSVELQNPTIVSGAGTGTLAVNERVGGVIYPLGSVQNVPVHTGSVIRAVSYYVVGTPPTLAEYVYVDNIAYIASPISPGSPTVATGQPGIGAYATPSGNSIQRVDLYPEDRVAPYQINGYSVQVSAFPNQVAFQWQGVTDDPTGSGLWRYVVTRNGVQLVCNTSECMDEAVTPNATYTYGFFAEDYHGNFSQITTRTETIPPAGAIDPRRVGVRPAGSYWGGAGEQIDTLSGSVNFTIPLFKAQGRGGTGVTFALSNNSQIWRNDNGIPWKLGEDLGYGFGWSLMVGSLVPYWDGYCSLDHYVFTDATGAEYRLYPTVNNPALWTSTEGIYLQFDSNAHRLYFTDGSFWVMGGPLGDTSWGFEADAGTMYPTTIEDSNGNQLS